MAKKTEAVAVPVAEVKEVQVSPPSVPEPVTGIPVPEPTKATAAEPSNPGNSSVFFVVYLLYKANFLSRHNLATILNIIKQPDKPEDIAQWLVNEASKAAR